MKEFFQRAWHDIKKRENLELYLVLLTLIVILAADLLGFNTYSAITEVNLAALAAMIYILIKSQHSDERIEQKTDMLLSMNNLKGEYFIPFEPSEFTKRLLTATELSLITICGNYGLLQQNLRNLRGLIERGGRLRVTIIDPDCEAFRTASARLLGCEDEGVLRTMSEEVNLSLRLLRQLSQLSRSAEQVQVKFTTLVSTGIVTIFDHTKPAGTAFVTFYGIKQSEEPGPSVIIQKKDSKWFNYFVGTFENTWASKATRDIDLSN